ncbi:PIG-L deacetylase family protein [Verrucomicrobiota bacterium sgz303538]
MPRALAIAAHPDDIEFVMAGTLLLLREAGWDIHYLNVSTGNLGSMTMSPAETKRVRAQEAQQAAELLGATWHAPIANDLEIFYDDRTLRRLAAIVREVDPSIVLTHSPEDYMEDHMNTSRLAVTAAFSRGMPNYRTLPKRQAVQTPVTVYHANPHGLRDGLRRRIVPGAFVDTTNVHEKKRAALACHVSQKAWLDATQGMDSYLVAMDEFSRAVGTLSGEFQHAEGWRRHSHLGFCAEDDDPLSEALGERFLINPTYEEMLERGH